MPLAAVTEAAKADDGAAVENLDEVEGFFEGEVETDEGDGKVKRRRIKGLSGQILRNAIAIFKDDGVRNVDDEYREFKVQSQSSSVYYNVIVDDTLPLLHCECPYHRRLRAQGVENPYCKHVKAVELWLDSQFGDGEASSSMSQRSVHVKKHPLYNSIRKANMVIVPHMIRCLVTTLLPEEEPRRRFPNGRKPKSASALYANLLLAASTKKGGREAVDPLVLATLGIEGSSMCCTARLGRMGDPAVRDGLRAVLERTARAVGTIRNCAVDATHFRTPYSTIVFEMRRGKKVAVVRAKRCKAHIGICTDTQIIFSFYVTNPNVSEANYFDVHLDDALRLGADLDTYHADHTYNAIDNINRLASLGIDPSYLEFADDDRENDNPLWNMALRQQRKRGRAGNHPRSLVESVNHVLRSHSRLVLAKHEVQRECEMLARAIIYNLRRLVYLSVTADLQIPFIDSFTAVLIADVGRDKRRKKSA